MDIFEKTPNGIIQHGPCPYCGEWNCWHNDSTAPVRYFMCAGSAPEAEELTERLRKSLDEGNSFARRPCKLVPGWPFPTRKSA
jgi:hypothetical protein